MKLNGCHNRNSFVPHVIVQDGWRSTGMRGFLSRDAVMQSIPFVMAKDCQYTHSELGQADAKCAGCKHRATAEKASQRAAEKGLA